MRMNEQRLQRLKAVELDLLKEFLRVCDLLELNYYVIGGTLLGAVRHKGFIPWDDDIDIGMPRADYETFIANGQAYMPDDVFIQTFKSDLDWPANFAKMRKSSTTFIESSVRNCDINHGVYIDIFPLDYYPEKHEWLFDLKKKFLSLRISSVFTHPDIKPKLKLKTRVAWWITAALWPSYRAAVEKREALYKSVGKSELLVNNCGAWEKKEIVPAFWYAEGCYLEFEGLNVRGPKHYDQWLTQVYGDYMVFPPVEKRVAHHYTDVIDLDTSYTEYRKKH